MATEKQLLGRIIHKHDLEENWNKATGFIPKQGEIIVYDIDENYNYERFKIGDGNTSIINLPFQKTNINDLKAVSYDIAQTLTDDQKAQARTNIGAASIDEVGGVSSWDDLGKKTVTGVVLPETEFDFMWEPQFEITEPFELIADKTYTVNWKDEVYECVARSMDLDGMVAVFLGDIDSTLAEGSPKNPPFAFQVLPAELAAQSGVYAVVINSDPKKQEIVKCSITGEVETITPIPEEYLPDTVAKIADIPTDYLTSIPDEYITETELESKGYLTEHQSLEGLATEGYVDTKISAIPTPDVSGQINTHNTATDSHNDIRLLIDGLTTRLNTLADSDDTTFDQMSEVVAYIKSNKSLIDSITTSKVNVADIIDNLTTNVANKPLSAAQGVALKALIDGLEKADIGLGNVDNTSDANKPVSTAQATAIADAKKAGTDAQARADAAYDLASAKVDKVTGKGLSTNDYTTDEKNKLAGIAAGAEANVNADWNATSGDAQILNKPTLGSLASKSTVAKTDLASNVRKSLDKADTALQSYTETDPTVPAWAKAASKPTYTAAEVGALPNTTVIPDALADLNDDANHRTVTDTEKVTWNAKSNFSGNYNDLTNKPTIPAAVTVDSALSSTSTNPVQNKVINSALEGKAASSHNHAASEITSGTFAAAQIPSLAASKITSGTFAAARIPSLAASKISAGTFAGQVVANSSGQSYSTYCLRNTRLASSDTNPTTNGQICWTYS